MSYGDSPSRRPEGAVPAWLLVQPPVGGFRKWARRFLWVALACSLMANGCMLVAFNDYFSKASGPNEKFHSGDRVSTDKVAIIKITGTIMPPFTERTIRSIEKARDDDSVKGVLLEIDSPGGLVADSHQIYRRLLELSAKKPVGVAMKRMAASGGYYVAMGAGIDGKIFAEPTTWTGSIGVIIPRYDLTEISKKIGVASDPLKTGAFKDGLSPFRPVTEEEHKVWSAILDDAYERFQGVIRDNRRDLTPAKVKAVATGQIFTADQAKANGLVDEIGYVEDALKWLNEKCGLTSSRVVTYEHPTTLVDTLLGATAQAKRTSELELLLDASVPRAYYYCSWSAGMTTLAGE